MAQKTITFYHALYDTGELIDYNGSSTSVITPETLTIDDVSVAETEYDYSITQTSISSTYFDSSAEEYYVYPLYAIHNGRVYGYQNGTTGGGAFTCSGTVLNFDIDNSWIIVYTKEFDTSTTKEAITYTENEEARLHVGSSLISLEDAILEESDDFDFYSINISTGSMSENFFTYGSVFSPTCTVEMTPTTTITQGNWFRVEFKIFGVWQNFGVFYVSTAPDNTSEYVSVSGIGILEYLSGKSIETDIYYSAMSVQEIVELLADKYNVPLLFNFDIKGTTEKKKYYENSAIVVPSDYEEDEDSDGNSTYTITEGTTDLRSIVSKLATAFYSNAIESNGVVHIIHNKPDDYVDTEVFTEDVMSDEPVQKLNSYYSTDTVSVSLDQMKWQSNAKAPVGMSNSKSVYILTDKYTDSSKTIIYYPLTISCDNGGWCEFTAISPAYWGNTGYSNYNMVNYAKKICNVDEPFYYYPMDCTIVGYSPLIYPGSCIKTDINGVTRDVYVGNVSLTWDGGMFTMDVDTPADIDITGVSSSTSSSTTSSTAGSNVSISVGIANSIANANFINDGAITGSKIASSTIEGSNINFSTFENGSISGTAIDTSTFTDGSISGSVIDTSKFTDGQISGSKITDSTIDGSKITDSSITGGKIADTTITNANIVSGTIQADKIIVSGTPESLVAYINNMISGATSVNYGSLDGYILTDGTIEDKKIAYLSADKITTGVLSANRIDATKLFIGVSSNYATVNEEDSSSMVSTGISDLGGTKIDSSAGYNVYCQNNSSIQYTVPICGILDNVLIGGQILQIKGTVTNSSPSSSSSSKTMKVHIRYFDEDANGNLTQNYDVAISDEFWRIDGSLYVTIPTGHEKFEYNGLTENSKFILYITHADTSISFPVYIRDCTAYIYYDTDVRINGNIKLDVAEINKVTNDVYFTNGFNVDGDVVIDGDFIPSEETYLGLNNSRWKSVYTNTLNANITVPDGTTSGTLALLSDINGYSLTSSGDSNDHVTTLADNTDLNDVCTAGVYRIASGTNAATMSNIPWTGGNSKLIVMRNTGSGTTSSTQWWGYQFFIGFAYNSSAVTTTPYLYVRYHASSTWYSWRRIQTDYNYSALLNSIIPNTTNSISLGSAVKEFANIYGNHLYGTYLNTTRINDNGYATATSYGLVTQPTLVFSGYLSYSTSILTTTTGTGYIASDKMNSWSGTHVTTDTDIVTLNSNYITLKKAGMYGIRAVVVGVATPKFVNVKRASIGVNTVGATVFAARRGDSSNTASGTLYETFNVEYTHVTSNTTDKVYICYQDEAGSGATFYVNQLEITYYGEQH